MQARHVMLFESLQTNSIQNNGFSLRIVLFYLILQVIVDVTLFLHSSKKTFTVIPLTRVYLTQFINSVSNNIQSYRNPKSIIYCTGVHDTIYNIV